MNNLTTLFLLVLILILIKVLFYNEVNLEKFKTIKIYNSPLNFYSDSNKNFPRIIHLIYIPWHKKTGKLKIKEFDFDHSFYNQIKKSNPHFKVILWYKSQLFKFVSDNYPNYINIWNKIKHPIQLIDFFRLLVVYHFGGIYFQYESINKVDFEYFIPPYYKSIRLFVETIISKKFSEKMKYQILRKGKPEELIRISLGCFSSQPRTKFLKYCLEKSWSNLHKFEIKEQYDILYVGGNAMFSEAYHEYYDKSEIILTYNTSRYISFTSRGSWRMKSY